MGMGSHAGLLAGYMAGGPWSWENPHPKRTCSGLVCLAGSPLALLHGRFDRALLRARLIPTFDLQASTYIALALIGSRGSDALDLVVCMHWMERKIDRKVCSFFDDT